MMIISWQNYMPASFCLVTLKLTWNHCLATAAKKASKFLDNAIKPSVENNDYTKFRTL